MKHEIDGDKGLYIFAENRLDMKDRFAEWQQSTKLSREKDVALVCNREVDEANFIKRQREGVIFFRPFQTRYYQKWWVDPRV